MPIKAPFGALFSSFYMFSAIMSVSSLLAMLWRVCRDAPVLGADFSILTHESMLNNLPF